ncbi:hypothetical protein, partial [Pusillimonas sp. (ex Stolz et al. 2005)]|uniref:hypothetical protein n=1 Tax=Pusillimonas sp. (ex Stolz et al. 2005) TaxID=1979962 RepID=UPI00261CB52A
VGARCEQGCCLCFRGGVQGRGGDVVLANKCLPKTLLFRTVSNTAVQINSGFKNSGVPGFSSGLCHAGYGFAHTMQS